MFELVDYSDYIGESKDVPVRIKKAEHDEQFDKAVLILENPSGQTLKETFNLTNKWSCGNLSTIIKATSGGTLKIGDNVKIESIAGKYFLCDFEKQSKGNYIHARNIRILEDSANPWLGNADSDDDDPFA